MNSKQLQQVLIIEGVRGKYKAQAATLTQAGYSVQSILPDDIKQLEELLTRSGPDIVLYGRGENMPKLAAVTAILAQDSAEIPVIVIAGKLTKRIAYEAERDGAAAVIQYDQLDNLLRMVRKELRSVCLHRRIDQLEDRFETIHLQNRISELEKSLRQNEARFLDLTDNSRNAIAYIHEGMHIYANASYCNLLGHENDDGIIGTPLLARVEPQHKEMLTRLLSNPFASHEITELKIRLIRDEAETLEVDMEYSAVRYGNKLCTQVMVRAPVEQVIDKPSPDAHAHHDFITGLYNRQYFMEALEEDIANSDDPGKFHAVTFILLDNFKEIREKIGVAASDDLIVEIAGLMGEIYGERHTLARFGDYTFTVLSNYSYKEGAEQLAETVRTRIAGHKFTLNGHTVSTTCSIGICVINEHVKDAQSAYSRADLACELARTSGGNQIHVHSTSIDAQIDQEVDSKMDEMVRKTIDEDRFYLVYQPVLSLNGKAGGHYEVLLRILDEGGRVVLPGQFLSMAEKSPMIMEIDRRVIQSALQTLADNLKEGGNTSLFIKLSGETIGDPQLPEWIRLQLQEHDLPSDAVIFEIPESVAVNKPNETLAFTKAVQAFGCLLAIEHFGYANKPDIIKGLSVDFLKIDGSLINNLASSKNNQEKVRSIVNFARSTNALCIAEHVDDAQCLVMLWKYNIDYIQGNLIKEPGKELTHDFEDEAALAGLIEIE